jgi:hypothetical protein
LELCRYIVLNPIRVKGSAMKKVKSSISKTGSYPQLGEYWDKHDSFQWTSDVNHETFTFGEFSKCRNGARMEELAHWNESRVIAGVKQSRLAV